MMTVHLAVLRPLTEVPAKAVAPVPNVVTGRQVLKSVTQPEPPGPVKTAKVDESVATEAVSNSTITLSGAIPLAPVPVPTPHLTKRPQTATRQPKNLVKVSTKQPPLPTVPGR